VLDETHTWINSIKPEVSTVLKIGDVFPFCAMRHVERILWINAVANGRCGHKRIEKLSGITRVWIKPGGEDVLT
jgi:hypothetical protein